MILDSDGYPMEYAVFVPMMLIDESEPSIEIGIDKAGGGTLGVFYANGSWSYAVSVDGEILSGDDLHSGLGKSHEDMARVLAGFLSDSYDAESLTDAQRAFLVNQADRLSEFASHS